jgi:hypothetical protein
MISRAIIAALALTLAGCGCVTTGGGDYCVGCWDVQLDPPARPARLPAQKSPTQPPKKIDNEAD